MPAKTARRLTVLAAAAPLLFATSGALALELGEKAPELDVTDWAQGPPVTIASGAGKTVFVVELWGTFDADSLDAIEPLSKLYEKNRAQGLEVVSVTTEPLDDVKKVLADRKVPYRVAIDQNHNTVAAYMGDQKRLPFAVVVDKTGTVVWKGDPTDGMAEVVADVLAGKFDLKKTLALQELRDALEKATDADDWDEVARVCDRIFALAPGDTGAFNRRLRAFREKNDMDGWRKFSRAFVDRNKDDAAALTHAAWRLFTDGRIEWRDVDLALAAAKRSVEVSKGADADMIDTYAQALAEVGLFEQAVEQEKKAAALDAKDDDYPKRVAYWQTCLATRQKGASAPAPPKKK